jgi:hypothetical protein
VHQAIGIGIETKRPPEGSRTRDPLPDERSVRHTVADDEHPQRNLGAVAEERRTDVPPTGCHDPHDVTADSLHIDDVSAVDPGMSAPDTLLASGRHNDSRE